MEKLKTISGIEQSIKYLIIFYGLIGAINLLFFCFDLYGTIIRNSNDGSAIADDLFWVFVFGFIYYGLKNKREWVLPLILICSVFEIWEEFYYSQSIGMFIGKSFYFGLGLFQIYFFRMPRTKYYFNDKSVTFLGEGLCH